MMKKKRHSATSRASGRGLNLLRLLSIFAILSLVFASTVAADAHGNWVSSFQVMNLGDGETEITIEYYEEDGTPVDAATHTANVAKGSSVNIYQPDVPDLPDGFKGSAVVSSGQPIAGIGSEQVTYGDGSIGNSQYSAFSSADVGTSFYLPNVNKGFGSGEWSSRITVQNATAEQVGVDITFYNDDASVAATDSVTLEGNGSDTLWQEDNADLSDGWLGSAVLEATGGEVGVIVDVMSADGRLETYNGFGAGATTMYLPTLLLGYGANSWNTSFQVLNVGSDTADVTMTYYTAEESTATKVVTTTLEPYESVNRYQPNDDSDLGDGWIGSVVVESVEQPIVAVGSQSSGATGTRLASIYNGAAAGSAEAVLPTVLRYFGGSNFVTSFQIMNTGNTAAEVTVEYYEPGDPDPVKVVNYDGTENDKIAPFTSVNRYQPTADPELGEGWQGSVRVSSDQSIVTLGSQNGLDRTGDAVGQYNGIPVIQ